MADQSSCVARARISRSGFSRRRAGDSSNRPPLTFGIRSIPNPPARPHGGKELADLGLERIWVVPRVLDEPAEELVRQEADVLGEEAEEDPNQEVRGCVRVDSTRPQSVGELGELGRDLSRDLFGGLLGAQTIWVLEGIAKRL